MSELCKEIPLDLWELILNHLPHHHHFNPLSLVSKSFLHLTNRMRLKLSINDALILIHPQISSLINKRFLNLNSIDFSQYSGNMDVLLLGIANTCLLNELHEIDLSNVVKIPFKGLRKLGLKMKGIRVLKCCKIRFLSDDDLIEVGMLFPLLEELDISYPVDLVFRNSSNRVFRNKIRFGANERTLSDFGIRILSSYVRSLRRINVSGNHFISDKSLVYLADNCVFLERVDVVDCALITAKGFLFLLQNCAHLNSVSVSGIKIQNGSLECENLSCVGLCNLYIRSSSISDEFIHMLVEARVDLRRLSLVKCRDFTFSSLALLLCRCDFLQDLNLSQVDFLTDESFVQLCPYFRNLVSLQLCVPSGLNLSTFHMLANNCPSLKSVEMWDLCCGILDTHLVSVKYANIISLNLSRSCHLDNICLRRIALACPNVEMLDISNCIDITEKCLSEILDTCHEIRHLRMASCRISSIGKGLELPKLEVIHAASSNINDEGLAQIAIRCPRVLELDLAFCFKVTDRGVKELVGTCQLLRKIHLMFCSKINDSIVEWMISTRPSLVKIVPPSEYNITENQKIFYLQHGCQVGRRQ